MRGWRRGDHVSVRLPAAQNLSLREAEVVSEVVEGRRTGVERSRHLILVLLTQAADPRVLLPELARSW